MFVALRINKTKFQQLKARRCLTVAHKLPGIANNIAMFYCLLFLEFEKQLSTVSQLAIGTSSYR